MNVTIPKGDVDTPGPCWISLVDSADRELKPIIKCQCGELTGIGLHHVHPDGRVTASYYHQENNPKQPGGCGWHVFLTLAGWSGSEFPPRSGE